MGLFHRKKKDEDVVLRSDHDDELEEVAEDDAKKKSKKPKSKFFQLISDKHHKIEKKAISFLSVFLVLCIGVTVSLVHAHHDKVVQENETTNLSSNVGWSLASGTFKIGKAWTTPNRSLVVVPLTFSQDAFQSISSDATHYAIKIGTEDKYLESCPKAQLILFGNTTQGALVIQNVQKFPSQVMTVVFEELKQLSNQDNSDSANQDSESGGALQTWMNTYGKKHNVTYFKINPGASNVNVFKKDVSFKSLNLEYLYNTLFANGERQDVKKNIAKTQNDLTYQMRQAQNYMRQIDAAGYKTPQEPPWMNSNWRPQNSVDPNTGQQKSNTDDAQQNYQTPSDLPRKDGKGSMQQDANAVANNDVQGDTTNNNDSNSSSTPQYGQAAQAQSAEQAMNQLTNIWTNIYNDKINLYVTYNQQLYNLKYIADQQRQSATESLMKNFKVISPEKINK